MARHLLHRKHAFSILIVAYERGAVGTSEMIRAVHGHPAAVLETLQDLERLGILSRIPVDQGRRKVEIRLTVKGLQLMETSVNHWSRLIGKWDTVTLGRRLRFG